MKVLFSILAIVLCSSCQAAQPTPNKSSNSVPSAPVESKPQPVSPREAYPRDKAKSSNDIYTALLGLGVKPKKQREAEVLRVFDVFCRTQLGEGDKVVTLCEAYSEPSTNKKRIVTEKSGAAAEKLHQLLTDFPIDQGDSGVSTPFMECAKRKELTSCHVAINVDYQGP